MQQRPKPFLLYRAVYLISLPFYSLRSFHWLFANSSSKCVQEARWITVNSGICVSCRSERWCEVLWNSVAAQLQLRAVSELRNVVGTRHEEFHIHIYIVTQTLRRAIRDLSILPGTYTRKTIFQRPVSSR